MARARIGTTLSAPRSRRSAAARRHRFERARDAGRVLVAHELRGLVRARHRVGLHDGLLGQHARRRELILDLAQRGEHRPSITLGLGGVRGFGLRPDRTPRTAVEQRQRERRPDRPEAARRLRPAIERGVAIADRAGEREVGIERGLRDADLCIGRRHAALGGGDVGAAFEQRRRQPWRQGRCGGHERRGRDREACRGFAQQQRDAVLQLRALHRQVDRLRARRVALRARLHHVGPGDDAGGIAVLDQLQVARPAVGRRVEQPSLLVGHAQQHVVLRELGLGGQLDRREVRTRGGLVGATGLDLPPHPPPQVRLPRHVGLRVVVVD
ncbi:MAG: hypothetical protein MUF30_01165, partial [Burkholderiales bacterium]|nr:hypothetical protein [Burkholderiales bacterium]